MAQIDEIQSVGVLVDGKSINNWKVRSLTKAVKETNISIDYVFVNTQENKPRFERILSQLRTLWSNGPWSLYLVARVLNRALKTEATPRTEHQLSELAIFNNAELIEIAPEQSDSWNVLNVEDTPQFRECDLCVRFGFGMVKGDFLDAPTYGVLSFHHGDFTKYRGRPMGFWEYIRNEQSVGVTLQRLNDVLDGGEIVASKQVNISNCTTYNEITVELFDVSNEMLAEGIKKLDNPDFEPKNLEDLGDIYSSPGWRDFLKFAKLEMEGRIDK